MQATVGDQIVIHSQHVDMQVRAGEIIDVRGPDGTPPFVVRWVDGHEGLIFPGPDAEARHRESSS
jgi:hypothetical protein